MTSFRDTVAILPGVSENASANSASKQGSDAPAPLRHVSTMPHRTPTRITSFLVSLRRHFVE